MKSINIEQALQVAKGYLNDPHSVMVEIEHDLTIERGYGWVFFYNSTEFVRTRKIEHCLVPIEPFLVLRNGGGIVPFDSGTPIEKALAEYEQEHGLG